MSFEEMLSGGHPNSLGRTEEVVALVLEEPARLEGLFDCYRSEDAVVRLRVSSAMKRIDLARRDLLLPLFARFVTEVGGIDQPSAQWTLAQLFGRWTRELSADERATAQALLQRNLQEASDWIVLNTTMETLTDWAASDPALARWLRPHLARLAEDPRKSVSARARKYAGKLST